MAYRSPYKSQVLKYVAAHPGCSKADLARYVTYKRHFHKSYHIVNTAIRSGALRAERDPNHSGRYALYLNDPK